MNPRGHYHTYVRSDARVARDGRRTRGPGMLWQCTGCEKDVWTVREDGPQYGLHPWALNGREAEALTYLTDGRTVPYVAHHMGITLRGAQNIVSVIRRKIGADTLDEAVEEYRKWELELSEQRRAA